MGNAHPNTIKFPFDCVSTYGDKIHVWAQHKIRSPGAEVPLKFKAIALILLSGTVFGTTLLVSRFGVGQFHPTTFVGLRLLMAGLMYAIVYGTRLGGLRWPADRSLWRDGSLFGVFGTAVPMATIVGSLLFQSSGITALLLTSAPALTVLLAHFFLPDERLTLKKSIGVSLALGGAVILALRGESGLPDIQRASPTGYALVLVGVVSGSASIIFARRRLQSYHSMDVSSIRIYAAMVVVLPLSLLLVGLDLDRVNPAGVVSLLYAAVIGTFFGFLLEFYIIQRFGATPAVMAGYVIPVVAMAGGVMFLGEVVTWEIAALMVMILAGVYLVNQG